LPMAYETLLVDVMAGDATLFMRTHQIERAWWVITLMVHALTESLPVDFPNIRLAPEVRRQRMCWSSRKKGAGSILIFRSQIKHYLPGIIKILTTLSW
jgi:hypothetical protein